MFQGYDDGTFQPKGAITRAEVAAIIYRIVTGDVADTQVGIYADYNKFDDARLPLGTPATSTSAPTPSTSRATTPVPSAPMTPSLGIRLWP